MFLCFVRLFRVGSLIGNLLRSPLGQLCIFARCIAAAMVAGVVLLAGFASFPHRGLMAVSLSSAVTVEQSMNFFVRAFLGVLLLSNC